MKTNLTIVLICLLGTCMPARSSLCAIEDEQAGVELELSEDLANDVRQIEKLEKQLALKKAALKRKAEKAKAQGKTTQKERKSGLIEATEEKENGHRGFPGIDEEEIEEWAENYGKQWEKWADRFERKMERWAEGQEKQWNTWADRYSKSWDKWGKKIESGEIEASEIEELLERNLEMLGDMPLDSMIDGLLKNGLGELKNAPFENLAELNGIIGSALERSLRTMEQEFAEIDEADLKEKRSAVKTHDLEAALGNIKKGLDAKTETLDRNATAKLKALENFAKLQEAKSGREKAEFDAALQRELADLQAALRAQQIQAQLEHKQAKSEKEKVEKEKDQLKRSLEQQSRKVEKQVKVAKQVKFESMLNQLKKEKEKLELKNSQIEEMRRQIDELRKEVRQMKESNG